MWSFFGYQDPFDKLASFANFDLVENFLNKSEGNTKLLLINKLQLLLRPNPNIHVYPEKQQTILHAICEIPFKPDSLFNMFRRNIIINAIELGINVDLLDSQGNSAVIYLIKNSPQDALVIKCLLYKMKNVNIPNGDGNMIICFLANNENIINLYAFLEKILQSTFVFTLNNEGNSALTIAQNCKNAEFLEAIIKLKAEKYPTLNIPKEIYQFILEKQIKSNTINLNIMLRCLQNGALLPDIKSTTYTLTNCKDPFKLLEQLFDQYFILPNQSTLNFAKQCTQKNTDKFPTLMVKYAQLLDRVDPNKAYHVLGAISKFKDTPVTHKSVIAFIDELYEAKRLNPEHENLAIGNLLEITKIIKVDNRKLYYQAKLAQAMIVFNNTIHLEGHELSNSPTASLRRYDHIFYLLSKIKRKDNRPELKEIFNEAEILRKRIIKLALDLPFDYTIHLDLECRSKNLFYLACELENNRAIELGVKTADNKISSLR